MHRHICFKKFIVISFAVLLWLDASAQKNIVPQQQVWLGYFNQTRLSKHWGLWLDVHYRTRDNWVEDPGQFIARLGGSYYLNDRTKLTAGYALVNHFPADNHPGISQPEHRPWQQVQWHTNSSRFKLMQWVRTEERFRQQIASPSSLGRGYDFNWRVRYNIMLQFPLNTQGFNKNGIALALNNETMFNLGKEIVYNHFDQNRLFAGLHIYTSAHSWFQLGYMNLFQQRPSGINFRMVHAARLFYFQNLDLRGGSRH